MAKPTFPFPADDLEFLVAWQNARKRGSAMDEPTVKAYLDARTHAGEHTPEQIIDALLSRLIEVTTKLQVEREFGRRSRHRLAELRSDAALNVNRAAYLNDVCMRYRNIYGRRAADRREPDVRARPNLFLFGGPYALGYARKLRAFYTRETL